MRFIHVQFLLSAVFFVMSCQTAGKTAAAAGDDVKIEEAFWVIFNIPEGFFRNWDSEKSCYGVYGIHYSGVIKDGDIVEAGFHTRKINYRFEIENNIDFEKKVIGTRQNKFEAWQENPWSNDIFHIGHTHYWFKTKDGNRYDYFLDLPRCGRTTSDGIEFVYTEDAEEALVKLIQEGKYRAEPCLRRPQITDYSIQDGILKVKFSVVDERFNNGNIVFFDKDEVPLAGTELFLSPDKKLSLTINKGEAIYHDGEENEVTVDLKNVICYKDKTLDSLVGFYVVICDGKQYANLNDRIRYDFVSMSNRIYLTE
jgi:hypothetical protein